MELGHYDPNVKPDKDGNSSKQAIFSDQDDDDASSAAATATIQPLPLPPANNTLVADGCPGAYAVSSLRPHPNTSTNSQYGGTTDSFPALGTHTAGTATTVESDEDNTQDHLVEAHVVVDMEDSDIVVVAEEIGSGNAKQEEMLSTSCSYTNRATWLAVGMSSQDLYDAIDAYIADNSPNSSISQQYGWPIGTWCVTKIQRFAHAFQINRMRDPNLNADQANHISEQATTWTPVIGGWDMSNAQDMEETFRGVRNLSTAWGIHHWNTSGVVSLKATFMATRWSQEDPLDLSSWDVSSVQSFNQLFRRSNVQQQANISHWNTANLVNMGQFAARATQFNEDLSVWDTRKLRTLHKAFQEAHSFDQDLSQWQVGSLTSMNSAFQKTDKFNSPLHMWDVSRVQSMLQTFEEAKQFNQDISGWNVSSVTDLRWAFKNATNFSQSLCSWGSLLPAHVSVTEMFQHTNCPNTSDPVLLEGGPFCFNCG
ncbi:expressed unknown protein [Seminavis robusta]|uniref:BspA family leucine-rich repeat surface protein n=1 Tax=Seminavis robusta TaxID=568900 RepID=A0A9N8H9Z0_9STRA|nr:expressed unknown protein [Seminavis robusta]|eukprot:Sro223_g091330.2  (482) ;mRNA; r:23211-24823